MNRQCSSKTRLIPISLYNNQQLTANGYVTSTARHKLCKGFKVSVAGIRITRTPVMQVSGNPIPDTITIVLFPPMCTSM